MPAIDMFLILIGKIKPGQMVYPDFPALELHQYLIWLIVCILIAGAAFKIKNILRQKYLCPPNKQLNIDSRGATRPSAH